MTFSEKREVHHIIPQGLSRGTESSDCYEKDVFRLVTCVGQKLLLCLSPVKISWEHAIFTKIHLKLIFKETLPIKFVSKVFQQSLSLMLTSGICDVHKSKMLYDLHECIAYHQSSWVTLYLVHSFRVEDCSFWKFSFCDAFACTPEALSLNFPILPYLFYQNMKSCCWECAY